MLGTTKIYCGASGAVLHRCMLGHRWHRKVRNQDMLLMQEPRDCHDTVLSWRTVWIILDPPQPPAQ